MNLTKTIFDQNSDSTKMIFDQNSDSTKMIFDLDIEKCVACGACAIACMDQNDRKPDEGDTIFRKIGTAEPVLKTGTAEPDLSEERIFFLSSGCMHCDNAPCITACPCNVLRKNENGLTVFDNTNCIGCHSCLLACPFGAPTFGPSGKMEKCNGCDVRIENGLEPACVSICPTKALICMTEEEYLKENRSNTLRTTRRLNTLQTVSQVQHTAD